MNPQKVHQFSGTNDGMNKKYQTYLNIEDQQQFMQNQNNMSSSMKSDQFQTRHTTAVSPNMRKDTKNLSHLLKELNSKNISDQYSTYNSMLSDNFQSRSNANQINYGKSILDQFMKQQLMQETFSKINRIIYYEAFQSLKQALAQENNYHNQSQKNNQNQSLNGFKTPTRSNIQKYGQNTSERSYQISTGYTDNLPYEEQMKKMQVHTNYFKDLQNGDKDELLKDLQQRLAYQESMISILNNKIKGLNDQMKADNASMIEAEVQKNIEAEEIKSLQEELRLHQRDNDNLNDQLTQFRNQNIIQSEKLNEFERIMKSDNKNNSDLLQRIREQQKLIDEKTNKNIDLQNQVLSLLQNRPSQEEELKQKQVMEMQQLQIQEQAKQIEYLERQNENLRQENRIFFQEKEMSLYIISQLEQKFDEERNVSEIKIKEINDQLIEKQNEIEDRERQHESQREEMLQLFEQTKQSLIRRDEVDRKTQQQNDKDLNQRFFNMKIKQINLAGRSLNKLLQKKVIKNAFKKINQSANERLNHRSIGRMSQSKSPANRSGNKRDLSPLRDKTFIERRRIVSFGKYLFLKYKKVMQRVFFHKLKALNKVQKHKESSNLEKKSIVLVQLLKKQKVYNTFKVWKYKMNVLKLIKTVKKIQFKKFIGLSFDNLIQRSEQQKNNQKMMKFCTTLCNFMIKLSKRQLYLGFNQINSNRILFNLRTNKLQIVLVKYLIKQKKNALITYFRKWRTFNEIEGVQEQANHESLSIQEKKRDLDNHITSFFGNRIDLEKIENQLRQRQAERSSDKKKIGGGKNFESTRTFAIPQKSQMENIYEEVSFRQSNQEKLGYSEIYDQVPTKVKHSRKESLSQKNLYLNEFDLNQDNMLFSNDIYKKNLSNRSCQSHKSSSQSYKSSQSGQSKSKNGTVSHSDQLIQSISHKYLYPNQTSHSQRFSQDGFQLNNSDMSIYSETLQEQRNFYKK